jgi:hypothetical protein
MKTKITIIIVIGIILTVTLLTSGGSYNVMSNDQNEKWAPCNPGGAYFWTVPDWNTSGVEIVIANDAACTRTTHITKYYHLDPTLGGMFPEATN